MNTSLIRFQQSFWPSQPLTPKAKNPRHRWNSIKLVKELPEWQKAATRNPVHQGKHHAKSPIRDHWCTEESASRICAGPNAFYTAHKQPTKLVIRCHKVMYADDTVLISANESIEHLERKTNTTLNTTNALPRTWF